MKFLLLLFIISQSAFAETDSKVMIRGKIGKAFDEKQVLIKDSLGQSYYLPRHVFPEKFVFKQDADFNIEVPEKEVAKIKVIKK